MKLKILAGASLVVLVLLLVLQSLRLSWAQGERDRAIVEAETSRQWVQNVNAGMTRLSNAQQQIQRQLDQNLTTLNQITQTPEDSDESMACLDQPVPVQLRDWMFNLGTQNP